MSQQQPPNKDYAQLMAHEFANANDTLEAQYGTLRVVVNEITVVNQNLERQNDILSALMRRVTILYWVLVLLMLFVVAASFTFLYYFAYLFPSLYRQFIEELGSIS